MAEKFRCEFCKPNQTNSRLLNCSNKEHHRKEYAKDYYSKRGKYLMPQIIPVTFTFKKCKICFE